MVSLRRATVGDIPFIMALLHRSRRERHAARGFGKPFLSALIDWIFTHSDNARCHLHVRRSNDRARHVYSALGFEDVGPEKGDRGSRTMVLTKAAWAAR